MRVIRINNLLKGIKKKDIIKKHGQSIRINMKMKKKKIILKV